MFLNSFAFKMGRFLLRIDPLIAPAKEKEGKNHNEKMIEIKEEKQEDQEEEDDNDFEMF